MQNCVQKPMKFFRTEIGELHFENPTKLFTAITKSDAEDAV